MLGYILALNITACSLRLLTKILRDLKRPWTGWTEL